MALMTFKAGRHDSTWRNKWIRELSTQLIIHEKITIEEAKAKEIRKHVDRLITMAKNGTLADRRRAEAILRNVKIDEKGTTATQKLFTTLAKRYKDRNGGYTRILKVEPRKGDNAKMAMIALV